MRTDLLIIGAGPFGLALAAWARSAAVDHCCIGSPMEFWRTRMPSGMLLRSGPDWHLDPSGELTLERFLATKAAGRSAGPLTRGEYLAYTEWLQEQRGIVPVCKRVTELTPPADGRRLFQVRLDDGSVVEARFVAVAIGFGRFPHVPPELAAAIPATAAAHTSELIDFHGLAGKRCLIIGGRQSAYEWAALLREAGAASVDIVHRHPVPAFAESHWSWVGPLVARMRTEPGWYRRLADDERRALDHRFWSEGRLKLEPWLAPRLASDAVRPRPGCSVVACSERRDGALEITLSDGDAVTADQVVFATGYKVQIDRVPFLQPLVASGALRTGDGFPVLNDRFETSVPGLFITSMPATRDFGPFLAFTVSAGVSAAMIGDAIGGMS